MKKNPVATVVQDEQEPIAAEIMAKAIVEISEAMKRVINSGIRRRAIVTLIHEQSKVGKREIELVLNNLDQFRSLWCTR